MDKQQLEAIRAQVASGEVVYQDQIDRYELLAASSREQPYRRQRSHEQRYATGF